MEAGTAGFKEARRELDSLLAPAERRVLRWLAERTPRWINSDHLTVLGLAAMMLGGLCYALSTRDAVWLFGVNVALALNWLGDSLDGTLARVRNRQRPRYGFYVDHIVDIFGALFLLGGLAWSSVMSAWVAVALLVAYFMLSVNIYLVTYAVGVFKISYGIFGGTELRILLIAANVCVFFAPTIQVGGTPYLLFDVIGTLAAAGLLAILLWSTVSTVRKLYDEERLPPA